MCPQMACTRRSVVTMVAFVWLFSTVHFEMCPQNICMKGCKVTLVAFLAVHNSSIGDLVTHSVSQSVSQSLLLLSLQSDPRDLWPLRHLIRVMRKHDNPGDLWHLRHWLPFWQLRTWIHDNLCYLTINCDTGQHSQFLRCFLKKNGQNIQIV